MQPAVSKSELDKFIQALNILIVEDNPFMRKVLRTLLTNILEEHLKGPVPEPKELKTADNGLTEAHRRWLMLLDLCAAPEALRIGVKNRAPDDASLSDEMWLEGVRKHYGGRIVMGQDLLEL